MGGLATEIDDDSTNIVIEGAHFSDTGTAKMARRHRLHSEASYRFERGVDRELPLRATERAAALLASLGGATIVPGLTQAQAPVTPVTISWPPTTRTGWPAWSTAWTPWSPGWRRSAATSAPPRRRTSRRSPPGARRRPTASITRPSTTTSTRS